MKVSSSDAVELRRLFGELSFRNTQRARSLAAKVEDALTGLATDNQVEANNSDASAGHPRMVQVSNPGIAETMEPAMAGAFQSLEHRALLPDLWSSLTAMLIHLERLAGEDW